MQNWRENPDVSLYLDGQASPEVRAQVEQAAAADPQLRQFLSGWPAVRGAFAALPRHTLPANFADHVLSLIQAASHQASGHQVSSHHVSGHGPAGADVAEHLPTTISLFSAPSRNARLWNTRRWNASGWLAVAASAALIACMLVPRGWFHPQPGPAENFALSPAMERAPAEDKKQTNPPNPFNEGAFKQAQAGNQPELSKSEGALPPVRDDAADEFGRAKESGPGDGGRGEGDAQLKFNPPPADAYLEQDGKDLNNRALAEFDRQNRMQNDLPSGDRLESLERQRAELERRGWNFFAMPGAEGEVADSDSLIARLGYYLGRAFRLAEENAAGASGYLAATPAGPGPEVMICDVSIPAWISDEAVLASFEDALRSDPHAALANSRLQFGQMLADYQQAVPGQDNREQAFQQDGAQRGAGQRGNGQGTAGPGRTADPPRNGPRPESRAFYSFNTQAAAAPHEEVYYIESSKDQIEAALQVLSLAANNELTVRKVEPSAAEELQTVMGSALLPVGGRFGGAGPPQGAAQDEETRTDETRNADDRNLDLKRGTDQDQIASGRAGGAGGGALGGGGAGSGGAQGSQAQDAGKGADENTDKHTDKGAAQTQPEQNKANVDQLGPAPTPQPTAPARGIALRLPPALYRNWGYANSNQDAAAGEVASGAPTTDRSIGANQAGEGQFGGVQRQDQDQAAGGAAVEPGGKPRDSTGQQQASGSLRKALVILRITRQADPATTQADQQNAAPATAAPPTAAPPTDK